MRRVVIAVLLLWQAGLSWAEPCSMPMPDECAHVGCVNDDMRSCESQADIKRLSETPAGKENMDICLRKVVKDSSKALTVDAVVAAFVTCQNKDAFES